MKKNQLNLFDNLPEEKKSGFSDEYQKLVNSEYEPYSTIRSVAENMSPEEYIHAVSEQPGAIGSNIDRVIKNSKQNTEENNAKAFEALRSKISGEPSENQTDALRSLLGRGKLTNSIIEEATKGDKGLFSNGFRYAQPEEIESAISNTLSGNDNLEEKHLRFLHEKKPEMASKFFYRMPNDLKNSLIKNPKTLDNIAQNSLRNHINSEIDNPDENADQKFGAAEARAVLNHKDHINGIYDQDTFDHLLGKLPEVERKAYVDKHLGIEGGEQVDKQGDLQNDDGTDVTDDYFKNDHDWQNWNNGEGYDNHVARKIAGSEHLSDEHAEHIKRHGDFDSKHALYQNPSADPRHGAEMFQKWRNDQGEHGYDSEQLQNQFKKTKKDVFDIDEVDEDYWNEHEDEMREAGDEWANESYSMDEYLRDNSINAWKDKSPSDHKNGDEWVDDHLRENHDWKGDNAKSKQNEGRNDFDALNKLAGEYDRNNLIGLDDFKEHTGMEHPSELGIPYNEKADTIDMDHIHDKLDEFGGPLQIDYANHDNLSIQDHPDYSDRYDDAVDEWRTHMDNSGDLPDDYYEDHSDDYYSSTGYNDSRSEGEKVWKERHFKEEMLPDLYANSHNDDRFVPEHLHDHIPELKQLKEDRINKVGDGANGPFLDTKIKDRSREHEYGADQHLYELVKDHAKANGGSIDVGTMHKIFPNQKEKWKKIFDGKGKLTEDEVDEKISQIPKTKYGISYGKWDSNKMQNVNNQDQAIIRLDHSDDSLAPIKADPAMFRTFNKVMDTSKRSGHPTKDKTIAWSRVDMSDPKHWMVDELQSDFGKTVTQYLKNQGHDETAGHIDAIAEHHKNWRETLLNHIIKEAKKHGVEKVSTHSPESKAAHTGADKAHSVYNDSYGKVPKAMGFKPVSGDTLPLSERGKSTFINNGNASKLERDHRDAMDFHAPRSLAHSEIADNLGTNPSADIHRKFAEHHSNMFTQHSNRLSEVSPKHEYIGKPMNQIATPEWIVDTKGSSEDAVLTGEPEATIDDKVLNQSFKQGSTLQGHTYDINPKLIKHLIDVADTLMKIEVLLVSSLSKNESTEELVKKVRILRNYLGYGT